RRGLFRPLSEISFCLSNPRTDAREPMLHASQPYVAPTLRNGVPGEGSGPSFRPPILGRVTTSKPRVVAGFGRRILALLVDWLIAYGLAGFALAFGWLTPAMLS